ncbi:MAG: hypothetical protein VW884_00890, partial [Bacteroidota bacterium]
NISLMYKEKLNLKEKKIEFIPELSQIGELNDINGHLLVDFLNIDKIFNLSTPSYIDEIIRYVNKLRNIH